MVQQSRRSRKQRQQKSQRGGSCSARPLNRQRFENKQRGGMAPIDMQGLLLDNATRVQAQVSDLDRYIDDSQILSRQTGGRRSQRQQKSQKQQRKQRQRTQRRNRSNRSNRSNSRSRNQRGGMQDFNSSGMLLKPDQYAAAGLPREFSEFGATMPSYNQLTGAQPSAATVKA